MINSNSRHVRLTQSFALYILCSCSSMALLTSLLCAAGWFIPAPALPHSNIDTVVTLGATNPSISNTTDLPTLKSDSWCQEIPNDKGNVVWHSKTGQCTYNTYSGEVTLAGAQWIQVKPTDDSNPPSSRKTAHKHKECKRDGNGKSYQPRLQLKTVLNGSRN